MYVCSQAGDDRPTAVGFFDLAANKKDFDLFEQVHMLVTYSLSLTADSAEYLAEKSTDHVTFVSSQKRWTTTTASATLRAKRCLNRSATVDVQYSCAQW